MAQAVLSCRSTTTYQQQHRSRRMLNETLTKLLLLAVTGIEIEKAVILLKISRDEYQEELSEVYQILGVDNCYQALCAALKRGVIRINDAHICADFVKSVLTRKMCKLPKRDILLLKLYAKGMAYEELRFEMCFRSDVEINEALGRMKEVFGFKNRSEWLIIMHMMGWCPRCQSSAIFGV